MGKRGPKKGAPNAGRPTKYKPEYDDLAYHMALLGATDERLAAAFDVSVDTIAEWKLVHPNFSDALRKGKDEADAQVVKSLYQRAMGYEHPAVKIITVANGNNQGSEVVEVPYVERYPPDTTAAIFWLKNRQRATWRDRQEIEHSGEVGIADALAAARARAKDR